MHTHMRKHTNAHTHAHIHTPNTQHPPLDTRCAVRYVLATVHTEEDIVPGDVLQLLRGRVHGSVHTRGDDDVRG